MLEWYKLVYKSYRYERTWIYFSNSCYTYTIKINKKNVMCINNFNCNVILFFKFLFSISYINRRYIKILSNNIKSYQQLIKWYKNIRYKINNRLININKNKKIKK